MPQAISVVVVERYVDGQRIYFHERGDLRSAVRDKVFSDAKKEARAALEEKGYEVLSVGFESDRTLRVIIRQPESTLVPSNRPLYTPPSAFPSRGTSLTASGRRR